MTSSMTVRKSERLLNLLIMLLVQRTYVPKERIRAILYPDSSTDAFEKMFERDKEELRSLGVPIEVGSIDAYFDDDPGYRIRPDEFALPDISLTADEAAVIGLATRVWEHARLAEATTEAVRKLTALGVPIDVTALDIAEPRLSADEPSFDVFWEATQERTPVEFDYRRSGATTTTRRHLQPWGVVRYSGRWYVVGLDTDRGEERVFRLSRVQGAARRTGRPGSYEVPPGTDVRATTMRLAPAPETGRAVLLVREHAGLALRRDAESVDPGVAGPDDRTGWDRVVISRGGLGVADELLGYGADVYVEEPADLRRAVVDRLTAAVGSPS
jgi:proteasome accessory factor B